MLKILHEIGHDTRPSILLPALCIGFILGLLIIIVGLSFAAMIFSGEMSHLAIRGAGLTLTGTFLACAATALTSSFRSVISVPQDAPVAIFSGAAALMAATMHAGTEDVFITVVAALMLSTILTAIFLFLIARFRLVHFFRYIPYPVIGGFLAGSGWILSVGSLEVMTGGSLSLTSPGSFFSASALTLWVPGTALALTLFFILRRFSHFTILPTALVLGVLLFHLVLYLNGISLEQAREDGLLFEAFAQGGLWPVFSWSDFSSVRWSVIFAHLPVLLTIPLITLIGLLLNMGGVQLASRIDIDMDREIMVCSASNALVAFAGSSPCYSALSLSMLGFKTNAYSRIVGLVAASIVALSLVWGGTLISVFPKAVLGGFLMLLGLFFLWDWAVETRKKMTWPDYCVVLIILVIVAWLGFFQGVVLGILLSVVLFVVRFSQVPILKRQSTGAIVQSRKTRPLPHKKILLEQGKRIRIFELSGYLFFGSVHSLIETILKEIEPITSGGEVSVLIDFDETTGIDISAVSAFVRLVNTLSGHGVRIIFTSARRMFVAQLDQHLEQRDQDDYFLHFHTLDQGLVWVEDHIIDEQILLFTRQEHKPDQSRLFDQVVDDMLKKLEELEYAEEILENLHAYSEELLTAKDDVLLAPGQRVHGCYWVQQGTVVSYTDEDAHEVLIEYGPGDVIYPGAVFTETAAGHLFKSRTSCLILFFAGENVAAMQRHDPGKAASLYALLLKKSLQQEQSRTN
jgi:sulfate permease, SulP family